MLRGPKDSYIEYFMQLMRGQETPSDYDFWAAIWTIGAVVGRSCYINRPRAPIFFNWYIIICAESGVTRKSTIINFANDVVKDCLPEHSYLIQNKTTPEKLWDMMSLQGQMTGGSHVVINISELVSFFGREGYAMGMPVLLTDLYDCPSHRVGGGSISYGTRSLVNPYITFLAGSTPSWLVRAINPDVIEGGFTSRVIFVSAERRKRLIFWPEEETQNLDGLKEYLREIRDFAKRIGTVKVDDRAKAFMAEWYGSRVMSNEIYLRSFESREDSHILRLAGTVALAQHKSTIGISEIELALYAISGAKKSGSKIFKNVAHDLRLVNGLDKIREVLLKRGLNGIKNWELYIQVKYHFNVQDYNAMMEILTDTGAVRQYIVPTPTGKGRPAKYFVATTKLLTPKTWNEIQLRSGVSSKADELPFEHLDELRQADVQALTDQTSEQKPYRKESPEYPSIRLDTDYTIPDRDD